MENASQPKKSGFLGNYDAHLFWPVTIIYLGIIAFAVIDPTAAGVTFSTIQRFVLSNFSWLILLTGASAICFAVWMACSSRYATVKLGAKDDKPEFSFFAWVAMLFCAALGTGFVIFGGAEPLYHLFTAAPTITDAGHAGKSQGVPEAIRLAVVNWGLFGWPLFAVGGWAIGYAAYRHNKPLRTSTGLYGLLGERCNDTFISKAVDVLAAIGTIGGVAMMIGLGVASISYAFLILFGIELNAVGKFAVMLCLILTYIISSATGLARGMRLLSESNGYLTLGLLAAVLFLGATPFTYVANMILQVTGEFLFRLPQNLLWTDAGNFEPREWSGTWFIFYILWNVAYLPFTGGFIARISRGRTMREFVCGTVLVPLFMTLLWFSIWGSNACSKNSTATSPSMRPPRTTLSRFSIPCSVPSPWVRSSVSWPSSASASSPSPPPTRPRTSSPSRPRRARAPLPCPCASSGAASSASPASSFRSRAASRPSSPSPSPPPPPLSSSPSPTSSPS
ncbi:MAG: BCCT family transporter [Bilophila sp.]